MMTLSLITSNEGFACAHCKESVPSANVYFPSLSRFEVYIMFKLNILFANHTFCPFIHTKHLTYLARNVALGRALSQSKCVSLCHLFSK